VIYDLSISGNSDDLERPFIPLEARLQPNIGNTTARFDGVHAFGYNSADSEPIWMKSGTLREHCLGLALVDFGWDPDSNESWRARRNFVF